MKRLTPFIFALLLCTAASAAVINVPHNAAPGYLNQQAGAAAEFDELVLARGEYVGNVTGLKKGQHLRAANEGKIENGVVVQPYEVAIKGYVHFMGVDSVRLTGLEVRDAFPGLINGAVMPGNYSVIKNIRIIRSETIGMGFRNTIDCTVDGFLIERAGHIGVGMGVTASDLRCRKVWMMNGVIKDCNYGLDSVSFGFVPFKHVRGSDGKIYRASFDEGGASKFTMNQESGCINVKFLNSGGPGGWMDVSGDGFLFKDCEFAFNHNIPGAPTYEGTGGAAEIGLDVIFDNCYSHDNTGGEFAVWEAPGTIIKNCVVGKNGFIEFRDIPRGERFKLFGIVITGTKLYDGARIQDLPAYFADGRIKISGTQNLTGPVVWAPGVTPPPVDPPPPPVPTGPESVDGTRVVGPGSSIIDSKGVAWSLTAGKQIVRNGVTQTLTAGVSELRYVARVVYQRATPLDWWWKWNETTWVLTTDPGAPPVVTPPPADLAELQRQLAAMTAARAAAIASGTAKDQKIAVMESEITKLRAQIVAAKAARDQLNQALP